MAKLLLMLFYPSKSNENDLITIWKLYIFKSILNYTIIIALTSPTFVLINCDFRFSPKVIEELKRILEILNPRVQSIYKIIAKVNADSDEQLYEIMRKVRENRRD